MKPSIKGLVRTTAVALAAAGVFTAVPAHAAPESTPADAPLGLNGSAVDSMRDMHGMGMAELQKLFAALISLG